MNNSLGKKKKVDTSCGEVLTIIIEENSTLKYFFKKEAKRCAVRGKIKLSLDFPITSNTRIY